MRTARDKSTKAAPVQEQEKTAGSKKVLVVLRGIKQAGSLRVKTRHLSAFLPDTDTLKEAKEAADAGNIRPILKLFRKHKAIPAGIYIVGFDSVSISDK
jgi:hypothetical protein